MGAYCIYTTPGGATGALYFDVVISESLNFPNTITEHVVEQGADITDNVRVGLKGLALEVFITNEPIDSNSPWASGVVGATGPYNTPSAKGDEFVPDPFGPILQQATWFTLPIGVPLIGSLVGQEVDVPMFPTVGMPPTHGIQISPNVLTFDDEFDAVSLTHDLLDIIRSQVMLMTVYGSKGIYPNMVIDHFSMARSKETGTGATFTIEFKEIRMVTSKVVNLPKPEVPRGGKPVAKGTQATTPVGEGSGTKKSLLKIVEGWFGGGLTIPGVP